MSAKHSPQRDFSGYFVCTSMILFFTGAMMVASWFGDSLGSAMYGTTQELNNWWAIIGAIIFLVGAIGGHIWK